MSGGIVTSVFDLFKVGPGPSSSHTIGPMKAGYHFLQQIRGLSAEKKRQAARVEVTLYGSLSATGKGHGTDKAVLGGLLGVAPEQCPLGYLDGLLDSPEGTWKIELRPGSISFREADIIFDLERTNLPNSNTLRIRLLDAQGGVLSEREYYSVGGGFLQWDGYVAPERGDPVHPFTTMRELKKLMETKNLRLVELVIDNERAITGATEEEIYAKVDYLFTVMERSVEHGLEVEGMLPGPLNYYRKAPGIYRRAKRLAGRSDHFLLYLCAYAFAVAEENAAGQPVVTSPTCGSAGVMAATYYFMKHYMKMEHVTLQDGLMAAAVIGFLAKHNASIAGAEVGCQGEVGVASSMSAALLTYANTSEMRVVENAAETALEHHLGMTCDPVCGYVQIPCIERNAMGAVKAYTAYLIAGAEISRFHRVDLDKTIRAMVETGRDMNPKYRETAAGGLATLVGLGE
ncbi:MAG: L-serine ammonia-lyase [Kiritimatiellae bacterium]|nr:L-serine ammonia-lyase [Kiritimatiellia bacterium]